MIKFTIIIQFFCSLFLINACKTPFESQRGEIKMLLSVQNDRSSVEKTLNLDVSIQNNLKQNIWILDFPEFSTHESSVFQILVKKDGEYKVSPDNLLVKKRIPNAGDYIKLEPKDTLNYNYKLDFTELVDDYSNLGLNNKSTDFGEYQVQVLFNDKYLIKNNAVKNLSSNRIKVNYVNEK